MSDEAPSPPRTLSQADVRGSFDCGAKELDEWLQKYALQNQRTHSAVTYVACVGTVVVGYYSIAAGSVAKRHAAPALAKGAPTEIPCILFARLAVDKEYQGSGLGAGLLLDALRRAVLLSDSVGAMAVLIHARDNAAKAFYERLVDFQPSPLDDLQLMVPTKDLRRLLA